MSDSSYSSVTLLLHGDGSDGSTTFTDNSSLTQTISVVGSAQVDTAQSKWGGASIYIPGDGSRLTAPAGTAFAFGSGDFCIELWVRPYADATAQGFQCFASSSTWTSGANSGDWALYNRFDGVSSVVLIYKSGASFLDLSAAVNINNTSWHHIAVARSGTDLRLFVDGALGASATYSGDFGRSDKAFMIGAQTGDSRWFDGHIDDVRVTKGVARYTAAFTPPTAAFSDTLPPPEVLIAVGGPLGVSAALGQHQFAAIAAPGPLGAAPVVLASQYYSYAAAPGPLSLAPQLLGFVQSAMVAALGPLGAPALQGAVQFGSVASPGPLGTAAVLGTAPIVATFTAAGPLGAGPASVFAWHDFTGQVSTAEAITYAMDLVTPGGLVRVPISSWQATLQTDAANYVQCVVPAAMPWVDAILAATEFVISRRALLNSGARVEYAMARAPLEQRDPSHGPANYTVVLSGYADAIAGNTDPPAAQDRPLQGVRSIAGLPGGLRIRCAVDWLLRPGMRATYGATSLIVSYVNYYCLGTDQYMDVGERT